MGEVLGVRTKGMRVLRRFDAEYCAILEAMSWATEKGWKKVWIGADSSVAVSSFNTNAVSWKHEQSGRACKTNSLLCTFPIPGRKGTSQRIKLPKKGSLCLVMRRKTLWEDLCSFLVLRTPWLNTLKYLRLQF
ncbi:hypothetical protein GIB67_030948 [Kingdonia uniflora]|uniref:RNase H type-1 domain-containing protein n=1 Tax=Kingdonia uniflora TaxID=39325 RepID=A0A7J7L3R1_9MAGN|nr:hypothetical protein GIB67_030948 [Kingdonia uniflora]